MKTADDFKEKIRAAEAAVSEMKDPELKRVAFETVLANLLGATTAAADNEDRGLRKKPKKKTARSTGAPRAAKTAAAKTSDIKLDVGKLNELKEFYDHCAPDGTENVVFTLARFISEKMKQKTFHAADLLKIYQNLLPLKPVTKPPAMSLDEVTRACRWLVAPSRRKQWLAALDGGTYEISPQGMIHASYDEKVSKKKGAAE